MNPARLWPAAVVAVLTLTVAANVFLLLASRGRDAAAVEPDYYRRAVRFDSTLAEARSGAALGWEVDAGLGPLTRDGAGLTVRVAGPGGAPLAGARVTVAALHNLDAAHPVTAVVPAAGPGLYATRLPLRHAGLWELRLQVARGGERREVSLRREAVPAAPDPPRTSAGTGP